MCNAILPFAFDAMYGRVGSIALIVSPLKALMKDQVSLLVATLMVKFTVGMACMQVSSRGLSAAYVIGENDKSQLTEILNGKFQLVPSDKSNPPPPPPPPSPPGQTSNERDVNLLEI